MATQRAPESERVTGCVGCYQKHIASVELSKKCRHHCHRPATVRRQQEIDDLKAIEAASVGFARTIPGATVAQAPRSLCRCGHTGDGGGAHGLNRFGVAPGHGACTQCPCPQFSWRRWLGVAR
jgi:hypothetical protein